MDRILFENVRCFGSRQDVPLAPLTLLVGENSSGKSTFLALVRIAWDLAHGGAVDFNEEPFLLGSFSQIVHSPLGLQRKGSFLVGCETVLSRGTPWKVEGSFVSEGGQPVQSLVHQPRLPKAEAGSLGLRPHAFAPVRTSPRRTYDPIGILAQPEGSHVPMVLAHIAAEQPEQWKALVESLTAFGRQTGLFQDLAVRRLGDGPGDPFQIQVRLGGSLVNLIDVGYGVSQILPIVVDCLRAESGSTFLLQQPEVHLHPRAQAELGSFLGVLAKQQNKRFVIETHSDYLVDRIRMDVRDGRGGLRPEDVSLLYFERENGEARIHRLELDAMGNIVNPPDGYRRFFLEEERRFLGG